MSYRDNGNVAHSSEVRLLWKRYPTPPPRLADYRFTTLDIVMVTVVGPPDQYVSAQPSPGLVVGPAPRQSVRRVKSSEELDSPAEPQQPEELEPLLPRSSQVARTTGVQRNHRPAAADACHDRGGPR